MSGVSLDRCSQAVSDCDAQWSQYPAKIPLTAARPLHKALPTSSIAATIAYVSLDWIDDEDSQSKEKPCGYVHVIEQESKFSFRFGLEIVDSALDAVESEGGFTTKKLDGVSSSQRKNEFVDGYSMYDWCQYYDLQT